MTEFENPDPESVENTQQTDVSEQESLQLKLSESEDKYVRLLAESENVRKRMLKERQELVQYAIEDVLTEFLHPLDNLENALKFAQNMSDEVKNWAIGFEMIASQFKQVLSDHGVEAFSSVGCHYDPHLHEAVEVLETDDHPAGTVIQEYAVGYKKGEKAIRVARVKIAKAPAIKIDEKGDSHE